MACFWRAPRKAYCVCRWEMETKNQSGAEHQLDGTEQRQSVFSFFPESKTHKATRLCVIINFIIITIGKSGLVSLFLSDFHTLDPRAVPSYSSESTEKEWNRFSWGFHSIRWMRRRRGRLRWCVLKDPISFFPRRDWVMDLEVGLYAVDFYLFWDGDELWRIVFLHNYMIREKKVYCKRLSPVLLIELFCLYK